MARPNNVPQLSTCSARKQLSTWNSTSERLFFFLSLQLFFFFYNLIDVLALLGLRWGMWASLVAVLGLSGPGACGILASWPGLKPPSSALEGRFFTSGSPGESLSPALLRYNWHIPLYKFKVYNVMIRYTYILRNYYLKTVNIFITSHF